MFRDAKVGDRVYGWAVGWGTIAEIRENSKYPIIVNLDDGTPESYTTGGLVYTNDKNQSLFWDEPKFEIPKKPFDLKAEYKKLKRKEFVYGECNYIISLKRDSGFEDEEVWFVRESLEFKMVGIRHYERYYTEEFTRLLNKHKVTLAQLEQVIREVENDRNNR